MNFRCPYDKGIMQEYNEGRYNCSVCKRNFTRRNNIYMFSDPQHSSWLEYGNSNAVYGSEDPILPMHFWIDWAAQVRPFIHSDIVFDLGAGDGAQTAMLGNRVKEIHWIDLSYYQLQKALKRDIAQAICVFSDVTRLPYDDCSADVVVCVFMFEHLPYQQGILMLKEVSRVLKKKSIFLLVTENPVGEYLYKRMLRQVTGISFGTPDHTHINMLFPEHTRRLLQQNGFKVVKSHIPVMGQNRFPLLRQLLPDFLSHNLLNISYGYLCEKL